jgi:hypothetical protein
MVFIEMDVRSSFYMNMEAFHCIEMKALLLALQYLHNIVNISKRVRVFI